MGDWVGAGGLGGGDAGWDDFRLPKSTGGVRNPTRNPSNSLKGKTCNPLFLEGLRVGLRPPPGICQSKIGPPPTSHPLTPAPPSAPPPSPHQPPATLHHQPSTANKDTYRANWSCKLQRSHITFRAKCYPLSTGSSFRNANNVVSYMNGVRLWNKKMNNRGFWLQSVTAEDIAMKAYVTVCVQLFGWRPFSMIRQRGRWTCRPLSIEEGEARWVA